MENILEMRHITKYIYNSSGKPVRNANVKILDDVHFGLRPGEAHALLGANGAGKSTLMKILGGILPADGGEVLLDGQSVSIRTPLEARAHGIAFVHQELNLCGNISVYRNLFLGNELRKPLGILDKAGMKERAREALAKLGFQVDPSLRLGALSTAQQQIVEIAKALSYHSRIIIMDEPTASLTKKEIDMLFRIIGDLKAQGVSVIYISHRLEEIQRVGDRMTVLRDGCYIGTMTREEYSDRQAVKMMAGHDVDTMYATTHRPTARKVLEVRNLRLTDAAQPINFCVNAGEIVGLCGLVGSGRSEFARAVFGAQGFHSGEIRVDGRAYPKPSPSRSIERGMIYLTEDRKADGLILRDTVGHNLTLASLRALFPGGILRDGKERRFARDLIDQFEVKCQSDQQRVATLSGGNQQKVSFGKCFATKPKLLILDEPTRGIDVGSKAEIYRLMDRCAQEDVAVVMISSEMPELIGMSDRIYIMREGTITAEVREREQMTQENLVGRIIGAAV